MKGIFKKLAVLGIGVTLMAGVTGCSDPAQKINEKQTQLYVYSYNGGVGNDWLNDTIASFEELYKDTSFEEGKVGVQVIADKAQKVNGRAMVNTIASSPYDVIFNEYINYNEWVSKGLLLDISDIVAETGSDGKTIESKLSAERRATLTMHNGKYYAVPHYEAFSGVIYDKDLFDSEKLYYADDKSYGEFILTANDKKSKGPDGVYGTEDDGFPATMTEFFALCDYMEEKGITPFIWAGEQRAYTTFLLNSLAATWAGADEAKLNYSFGVGAEEGKDLAKIVKSISGDGNTVVSENVKITESNGYNMFHTEAKYRAMQFLFKIFNNDKYYYRDSMWSATATNRVAQETFIFSSLENNPIAMLIDGSWWEIEAADSTRLAVQAYGKRAENRNYGWLPLPGYYDYEDMGYELVGNEVYGYDSYKRATRTQTIGKRQVFTDYINSYCGINAVTPRAELAKLFVKYCYSDDGLLEFTKSTGMRKGVEYTVTDTVLSSVSKFSRNLLKLRSESDIIFTMSTSNVFINNEAQLSSHEYIWNSGDYVYPIDAYKNGRTGAVDYFNNMAKSESSWLASYGVYIK